MDMFFNELSVSVASHPSTAKEWMRNFMQLYKIAYSKGLKRLITFGDVLNQNLSDQYTIYNWAYDVNVDKESRELFISEITAHPTIESLMHERKVWEQDLFEFQYENTKADGLGAAFLFDSLAVSIDNNSQWDKASVDLVIKSIAHGTGILETSIKPVKHSSKFEHLETLNDWFQAKKKTSIRNGRILWEKRDEFFPNLRFCDSTRTQLFFLNEGDTRFPHILDRLFALQNYCATWTSGAFNPSLLCYNKSPESTSRLQQFRNELTKICPDGKLREFSWHFKFGIVRVYFDADDTERVFYIGYIGNKIQ